MAVHSPLPTPSHRMSDGTAAHKNVPFALLGYGFLYAWGYVNWETPALGTLSAQEGVTDLSWFVSALVTPVVLTILAIFGACGRTTLQSHTPHAQQSMSQTSLAAFAFALIGTILSSLWGMHGVAVLRALAIMGGICTGLAEALFIVLWSLVYVRFSPEIIEKTIPKSFIISLICTLVTPILPQFLATVLALLLATGCFVTLRVAASASTKCNSISKESGSGTSFITGLGDSDGIDRTHEQNWSAIARMLIFSAVAWAISCVSSAMTQLPRSFATLPIDLTSTLGYALAILLCAAIVRFAVRVDIQALAWSTLVPATLSIALTAFDAGVAQTLAEILNVCVGASFEIIIMLYFVRLAQSKGDRPLLWVSIGSAAAYTGIFAGVLIGARVASLTLDPLNTARLCLVLICIYVAAVLLIPQRRPYDVPGELLQLVPPMQQSQTAEGSPSTATASPNAASASASDALDIACHSLAGEYGLSPREEEVCALLAHGRTQTYIRDVLFLSKNTVSTHARHVYAKLGVHSKQELIDLAQARCS